MSIVRHIKAILVFFLAFLFFSVCFASPDSSFLIQLPEKGISGYQSNPITVLAPSTGHLKLEVWDDTTLYRIIEKDMPQGKSQLLWDGLGWNEEMMAQKTYNITGTFISDSGEKYTQQIPFSMNSSQQAILFALPSASTVFLESTAEWFLEIKLIYTDLLTAEFYNMNTGALCLKTSRNIKGGRVNQISYAALTGKHILQTGQYRVRIYGQLHPSYYKEFSLHILDGPIPALPLQITGEIMPARDDSDESIWQKMISPATIIDIKNTSHQQVFEKPDRSSKVLGTLHGQSQAVSVLDIQEAWVKISAWNHERGAPITGWVPRKVLKVVQPQIEFGILVDKKDQTLTLFQNGSRIDTLLVSTGRMSRGELYQETAAGSFLSNFHMNNYSTNGLKYDYVIRYDGGNLLHQIPYAWNESGKKDLNPGELYLGTKASHACIRVQEKPSQKGINAYWLWTHIPYHTRIIILDDPDERENLERIVTGNTPDIQDGLQKAWNVEPEDDEEGKITLTFGGDVVLGGRETYYNSEDGLPAYIEKYGTEILFSGMESIFRHDDLTMVNLECVLKDDAEGEDLTKSWRFRGLTKYINALTEGGIDIVNIANNHTIDYGDDGYNSTLRTLEGVIPYCGNENNTIICIRGISFGFGGCRETAYIKNPDIINTDIKELKDKGADYIIYQCHWGTEYDGKHNVLQEAMARACYRAGANLVIGHHPHVVQGIDWIKDMPVIYSLGNLMFGGTIKLSTFDAILVQLHYYPYRKENREELKIIPVLTSSSAKKRINDYQPQIATGADALRILQQLQKDTGFMITDRIRLHY